MSLKNLTITMLSVLTLTFSACTKKPDTVITTDPTIPTNPTTHDKAEMHFNFHQYFGNEEIVFNTGNYTTAQSEQITISTFNYWITNIKFVKEDGSEYVEPESYRLIRGDKHATHHFHVEDVPAGTYKGIKFMIGVDVPRNTSGAQTGALDPTINPDMFWSWSTGYIQAKLEGTSPQSTETGNAYQYHIGGVAAGTETPREVMLDFPNTITVGEQAGSMVIKADAAKWFPTPMPIASMAIMTHPGAGASKIADNYAKMFSVMSAGNE
ncbi:MAG: hypothetical protein H6551_00535 [Chitinophagales bacterium]|nr:hypothetical protein [Chitinophagales bacterium]